MCTIPCAKAKSLIRRNLDKTRMFRMPDKECINNSPTSPRKTFGGSVAKFPQKGFENPKLKCCDCPKYSRNSDEYEEFREETLDKNGECVGSYR